LKIQTLFVTSYVVLTWFLWFN